MMTPKLRFSALAMRRELSQDLLQDLLVEASTLSTLDVKILVRQYYQMQDQRIRNELRIKARERQGLTSSRHLKTLMDTFSDTEDIIQKWMDVYTMNHPVGLWMRSHHGYGPVITAGLLSEIKIVNEQTGAIVTPHLGALLSFAGMNPNLKWRKGEKRPWNAHLKRLTYLMGESFVKVINNDKSFYGELLANHKRALWRKNITGEFEPLVLKSYYYESIVKKNSNIYQEQHGEEDNDLPHDEELEGPIEKLDTKAAMWMTGQYETAIFHPRGKRTFDIEPVLATHPGSGKIMFPPFAIHRKAVLSIVSIALSHVFEKLYEYETGQKAPTPWINTQEDHKDGYITPIPGKKYDISKYA